MRIGFDAKRAYNNSTGLGNYSRLVLKSLFSFESQHDYRLYTPKIHHKYHDFLQGVSDVLPTLPESNLQRFLHPLWRSKGIVKQLQEDGIQLYHGLSNELPMGLAEAGIKSVLTLHDLIFLRYPQYYPRIDRLFYSKKFERSCQDADVIIAISQQTANDIAHFYGIGEEKVSVVYQDCDPSFRMPISAEQITAVRQYYTLPETYLLSVGTIEARKNQLNLLRAYAKLGPNRPPLVIVGRKTAYFEALDEYIQSHRLQKEVLFLEKVAANDLPALYAGARAMAYVSQFEGFGLPLLEAMCTQTPVLTSTSSCFAEVTGDAALYVAPDELVAMTNALHDLIHNDSLHASLKANCREQAARFSAQSMSHTLVDIYQKLLA